MPLDLSDKQETLLEFIKRFQEEKGRNPRLTELTNKFGVSNSAILQRLESLEKSGYIDMPEGVLSISTRPRYDIFISYSRDDIQTANKIHDRLKKEGFRVWKDNKLRTGDSFATEIFKAVRNSKVFLILLSDEALQSNFVKEELSHAKNHSIYKGYPKIIPVVIKKLTLEIPPEISNLQRLEPFNPDSESEMIQLLDDIQIKVFSQLGENEIKKFNSGFSVFKNRVIKDLNDKTQRKDDYDYFEIFLEPLENPEIENIMQIEKILEQSTVDIKRWGGFNLPPFYLNSGNIKTVATQGDLRFFKEFKEGEAWFRDWELYAFYMDKNGNFFYRNSLRESYAKDINIAGTFSIDWLVLDVTRSIMFAKNLIEHTACKRWKLTIHYHGIKGKRLTILNSKRFPLFMNYVIEEENDYENSLTITTDMSIEEASYNICYEVLWLFGWKNINETILKSDISSISKGVFPE